MSDYSSDSVICHVTGRRALISIMSHKHLHISEALFSQWFSSAARRSLATQWPGKCHKNPAEKRLRLSHSIAQLHYENFFEKA